MRHLRSRSLLHAVHVFRIEHVRSEPPGWSRTSWRHVRACSMLTLIITEYHIEVLSLLSTLLHFGQGIWI